MGLLILPVHGVSVASCSNWKCEVVRDPQRRSCWIY